MSDISSEFTPPEPNTEQGSTGKNTDKSAESPFKKLVGKAILAALVLTPGIIHDTKISAPNIEDPSHAVAPSPDFKNQTGDTLQPYSPQPSEQIGNKELAHFTPSITILDFFPPKTTEGSYNGKIVSAEQVITRALATKLNRHTKNAVENPETYVMLGALARGYTAHGEVVSKVMQKTWKTDGLQASEINILPLQSIINSSNLQIVVDEMGNPGISISFEPQEIIDLLESDNSNVINGSFQVGDVDFIAQKKAKIIVEQKPLRLSFEVDAITGKQIMTGPFYLAPPNSVPNKKLIGDRYVPVDSEGNPLKPLTDEQIGNLIGENEEANTISEIRDLEVPTLDIRGSYTAKKAEKNLPKLFQSCLFLQQGILVKISQWPCVN